MRSKKILFLAVMSATALSSTVAVAAALTPYRALSHDGLGSVRFGMTVRAVERALEAKLAIMDFSEPSCKVARRSDGQDREVWYMFLDGNLARIDIFDNAPGAKSSITTDRLIGIGSTENEVERAYGQVTVEAMPEIERAHLLKVPGPGRPDSAITFDTRDGRVTSFGSGRHPAIEFPESCN